MSHWAKFSECIADIEALGKAHATNAAKIRSSQLFMLPEFDFDSLPTGDMVIVPPYPSLTILHEVGVRFRYTHVEPMWLLHHIETWEGGVAVVNTCAQYRPTGSKWMPVRIDFNMPNGDLLAGGVSLGICAMRVLDSMLRSDRVESVLVPVTDALRKSRERRGKLPLYAYKVLTLDGKVWDGTEYPKRTGLGYRSHLRRGYVNKKGTRVKPCFVHGRIPGFVDKAYEIAPSDKGHA